MPRRVLTGVSRFGFKISVKNLKSLQAIKVPLPLPPRRTVPHLAHLELPVCPRPQSHPPSITVLRQTQVRATRPTPGPLNIHGRAVYVVEGSMGDSYLQKMRPLLLHQASGLRDLGCLALMARAPPLKLDHIHLEWLCHLWRNRFVGLCIPQYNTLRRLCILIIFNLSCDGLDDIRRVRHASMIRHPGCLPVAPAEVIGIGNVCLGRCLLSCSTAFVILAISYQPARQAMAH